MIKDGAKEVTPDAFKCWGFIKKEEGILQVVYQSSSGHAGWFGKGGE